MAKDPNAPFCAAADSFKRGTDRVFDFSTNADRQKRATSASGRANKIRARLKKLEKEGKL